MNPNQHISAEMIECIRKEDRKMLSKIYAETYPMVAKYVRENSGTEADAQDVFQDGFYLFIKKVKHSDFELTSKISTFLFGISRNLWLKELTKKKLNESDYKAELEVGLIEEDEHQLLAQNKLMKKCIDLLGEPCKTIIVQFYFFQASMQEIAEKLNYTNANNAKNQKYKCFVRLKKMVLKEGTEDE